MDCSPGKSATGTYFFLFCYSSFKKVTTVKRLLILLVLCTFLISCNKAVYFFSEENVVNNRPVISDRKPVGLFKKKARRRRRSKRRREKFVYKQPPKEQMVVLDGQVEFVQLTSSNIQPIDFPVKKAVTSSVVSSAEKNNQQIFEQPSEVQPISPIDTSISLPVPHGTMERSEEHLLSLGKQEKKVRIDLPMIQAEKPQHPSIPALHLDLTMEKPNKVFVPRPLDVLFVMDTSESMYQHLTHFKRKFAGFLQYFSTLNWRLAITNADHGDTGIFLLNWGALEGEAMKLEKSGVELSLRYLHPGVSDYNLIFLDSISQHKEGEYTKQGKDGWEEDVGFCELPPYCQSYQEQPLKSLKSALSKNVDFFRKEADLVTVVISNSRERADNPDAATKPEEVIKQFKEIHGTQKRFKVYGVIIAAGDPVCLQENIDRQSWFPEGAFSERIAALSEMTGGEVFSICSSDYQALSKSIVDSFSKAE